MPKLSPELRTLRSRIAAHKSWAETADRSARTAKARQALEDKFLAEADGDPQRAASLRKAYYAQLAFKSAQARRRRSGASPPGPVPPLRTGGSTAPSKAEAGAP